MPLFVPVIIVGANAIGIAAGGYSAAQGTMKMRRGRRISAQAEDGHASALDHATAVRASVQEVLDDYALRRASASERVLERMVAYLRANNRLAEVTGIEPLSEVPVEPEVLDPINPGIDNQRALWSVLAASQAAAASPAALAQIATNVGKASTGTALKGLSGAAGKRATLAWLGGGAKAAGGGGMALGGVMGPLTAVGSAVTVIGIGANVAGEQYLSSTTAKAAQLQIAAQELELHEAYLDGIRIRAEELSSTLDRATAVAVESLLLLEQLELDHPEAEEQFARTVQLVATVSEIIRTRLADNTEARAESAHDPRSDPDQAQDLDEPE